MNEFASENHRKYLAPFEMFKTINKKEASLLSIFPLLSFLTI